MEPDRIPEVISDDIKIAIEYLKSEGCTEIYIFGSVAAGDIRVKSDIDIAVRGLTPENYFSVYGELIMRVKTAVDLVDLDLQKGFGETLISSGELFRVA
jgi:predicted nucleotidyltransferase